MKQFFISKWVQRLIQVKKWSFVQQKRQASRILNEQLFSVLFAVGGEMCRHKNTIGSLLGLPNFISVRASLSLPVEVSFLSKGNIFVFLTFILRHFHWIVKPKIKWLEFSLHFWSLLQLEMILYCFFPCHTFYEFCMLFIPHSSCFPIKFATNFAYAGKLFKLKLSWILSNWFIAIFDKMLRKFLATT